MKKDLQVNDLYEEIDAYLTHRIDAKVFLKETLYTEMVNTIYEFHTMNLSEHATKQRIFESADMIYNDNHRLNLRLDITTVDEFDNNLIYFIAGHFLDYRPRIAALADLNQGQLASEIAGFILKKYDANIYEPGKTIANDIAKAVSQKYKPLNEPLVKDIVEYIGDYYASIHHANAAADSAEDATSTAKQSPKKQPKAYFKQYINKIMEEKRYSQINIATQCALNPRRFNELYNGTTSLTKNKLYRIAIGIKLTREETLALLQAAERDIELTCDSGKYTPNGPRDNLILSEIEKGSPLKHIEYELRKQDMDPLGKR